MVMRKIRVYIASPYTKGDMAINVRTSFEMASVIRNYGMMPIAPLRSHFEHMMFPKPVEKWLSEDMYYIDWCDIVLRMDGESFGADFEVYYAVNRNKIVCSNVAEAVTWAEKLKVFTDEQRKNSYEWLDLFPEMEIHDPDGWDRENYDESMGEEITYSKFMERFRKSTVNMGKWIKFVEKAETFIKAHQS
jgi:hypothetical protein